MRKSIRDALAELCEHVTPPGIDCKTIDKREAPMELSRWSGKRCIVVEARNLEAVCVLKRSSQYNSPITAQYVVSGKKEEGKV